MGSSEDLIAIECLQPAALRGRGIHRSAASAPNILIFCVIITNLLSWIDF